MLLLLPALSGRRNHSLLSLLTGLLVGFFMVGCAAPYNVVKVKQYHLAITQGDTSFNSTFQALVNDFNAAAGSTVLTFETDASQANCSIAVVKGLVTENADGLGTGKVGLGQWVTQTKADSPMLTVPGEHPTETVYYSMNVQFDQDYLSNSDHYGLQKLFYHEVGHGLELEHDTKNIHSVMYPDVGVGDTKDFDSYFAYVRNYIAN